MPHSPQWLTLLHRFSKMDMNSNHAEFFRRHVDNELPFLAPRSALDISVLMDASAIENTINAMINGTSLYGRASAGGLFSLNLGKRTRSNQTSNQHSNRGQFHENSCW